MGCDTFELEMTRRFERVQDLRQFFQRRTEASHASVDLEMHPVLADTDGCGGLLHHLDLSHFPEGRR